MEQPQLTHTYLFRVDALNNAKRAEHIRALLRTCLETAPGGQKVETETERRILTLRSSEPLDLATIKSRLQPYGFHLHQLTENDVRPTPADAPADGGTGKTSVCIDGMTCRSCELTIERKWKKLDGVSDVAVNASTGKATLTHTGKAPTVAELQNALGEGTYIVSTNGTGRKTTRPSLLQLVGLFALVLLIGKILSGLGLLNANLSIGSGMSFGAIFVVGLVAASSSCIAVAGGLLLSSAAKFNERYGSSGPAGRMKPVALFVAGRIAGYAILGGLLGVVGKALSPSPIVTASITVIAALYMLVMGLEMLQIAPAWLKNLTPRMPKSLSNRVLDAEGKEHPLAPFALGAATFFLPCGFTQALQLYALTTGSFATGALSLFAFALGTAPSLLALGWASSSLKGAAGRFFFKFSGALVVVLGLWNVQNGLAIAGYPLRLPKISAPSATQAANPASASDPVPVKDGKQIVKMKVGAGYVPNHFTIRAGTPVRWEIDATNGAGCASVLVSRQLGIQKVLEQSASNVIEFTPNITGEVAFSCSMGMYRGSFTILPPA